jgi:putative transposase
MEHQHLPVSLVCRVLGAPRSTIYARRSGGQPGRPGPVPLIDDEELVRLIRQVLKDSPFAGEGYRKVRARLRREHGVQVSGKGVLRLLRREGCWPHSESVGGAGRDPMTARSSLTGRTCAGARCDHGLDPGRRLGLGVCRRDHYTAEAWAHVAKIGDRFAALQPVYDAVIDRFGRLDADVARGIALRHDWGPQYRSTHFLGSIGWLGITDDAAFLGEPETNGCAERWIRTLKEQCLWAELHDGIDELRQAVAGFVQSSNTQWLIGRLGHRTPKEAYQDAVTTAAA